MPCTLPSCKTLQSVQLKLFKFSTVNARLMNKFLSGRMFISQIHLWAQQSESYTPLTQIYTVYALCFLAILSTASLLFLFLAHILDSDWELCYCAQQHNGDSIQEKGMSYFLNLCLRMFIIWGPLVSVEVCDLNVKSGTYYMQKG